MAEEATPLPSRIVPSPGRAAPGGMLDRVSKAIVEELQQDGRRTYGAIAEAVGLSEAAVRQRVQKLRAVADQLHLAPSQLNVLVPEWTRDTVERIFATHLEDWPALLRSLRLVGDDVRQKARKQTAAGGGGGL